ncbi:MAG TPA: folate-binding protein [Candidatus Sulfotelmatobacter sp.]|nr:folate-binding protein [Candidatus Sulfotelmatobacter sp.]
MAGTALQTRHDGLRSADVGEYRGATTVTRFSDPQAEFGALRASCGVYDLGYRAQISLAGSDRVRWLNGMVTNNVRDLQPGYGVYAFLLNPQGHILGDLYAYNRGESILVETDRSQVEEILATFDHYIIMDDVEVKNLSEEMTALGIAGPRSREVLAKAGIEVPDLQSLQLAEVKCTCDCACVSCRIVRGDDPSFESYEIWLAPGDVKKTWDALVQHGATPIGSDAIELWRIACGIPAHGIDIRDRDLPQETEQARALNFNKGCYVGQEIVERIRSRGAVHRKFTGFVFEGDVTITPGAKVVAAEKEIGEITSVASLELKGGKTTVALGYIRREAGTPGREVTIGGAKATVAQPPLNHGIFASEQGALERHSA